MEKHMNYLRIFKFFYVTTLFAMFLRFFGLQSLYQYADGRYNMMTEMIDTDGEDVPAPAFTVLNFNRSLEKYYYKNQVCFHNN